MGDTIQKKFEKKYGEPVWRRFYKFVIKQRLHEDVVIRMMFEYMSDDTVRRYIRKLRGVDKLKMRK
jgi:hypothetical protein